MTFEKSVKNIIGQATFNADTADKDAIARFVDALNGPLTALIQSENETHGRAGRAVCGDMIAYFAAMTYDTVNLFGYDGPTEELIEKTSSIFKKTMTLYAKELSKQ